MQLITDLVSLGAPEAGSVVTIGNFDGFHIGHREVVRAVCEDAASRGMRSALVTFDRHPAEVLRPELAPRLLTLLDRKIDLIASAPLDYCIVIGFDEARAAQSAGDFVDEVLVDALNAREVVVGANFHFGHGRSGNLAMLDEVGGRLGFRARAMQLSEIDGVEVSSTRIRNDLAQGDVSWASRALARDHSLPGKVVVGDRRGRTLGFPTANLEFSERLCAPGDGVYAGWCEAGGERYPAAINVGRRPTFDSGGASMVEAHLLDFDGDLYGVEAEVGFTRRVRGEKRFGSADELARQIRRDIEAVRATAGAQ